MITPADCSRSLLFDPSCYPHQITSDLACIMYWTCYLGCSPDALANERLMYVADRIMMKWRLLGKTMGITNNRMDMAEYEVVGNPDKVSTSYSCHSYKNHNFCEGDKNSVLYH